MRTEVNSIARLLIDPVHNRVKLFGQKLCAFILLLSDDNKSPCKIAIKYVNFSRLAVGRFNVS